MTVLSIIGFLLIALGVYLLMMWLNDFTSNTYGYEIFNWGNYVASAIGYWSIFFGRDWYQSALKSGGDILNGQVLIGIGVFLILFVIYYNFKKIDFFIALILSIVQQLLYVGLAFIGILVLLFLLAILSQTKPVYNIN